MDRYTVAVSLWVSVEAPSESDALQAIEDTFGEGEICGLDIKDVEVEILD